MALQSKLFRGDSKLEAALVSDPAHVAPGAAGSHVGKIQQALNAIEGAGLTVDNAYGPATAGAVLAYKQKRDLVNRSYQTRADNVVGRMTMASLDADMVEIERNPQPDKDPIVATLADSSRGGLAITQRVAAAPFPMPKPVRPPLIVSPSKQFRFIDFDPTADFHDLLFKVEKRGRTFWVGAAVPKGIKDFTRAYIYFTPSTIKRARDGTIVELARDADYPTFSGGWATRMRNFIPMMGRQAAAASKPTILLITYMKASAFGHLNDDNIWSDRPIPTLNAVMNEIKKTVGGSHFSSMIERLGVCSFSSGVTPMRLAIAKLEMTGILKEVVNYDGPFLTAERKVVTFAQGALCKVFTQVHLAKPPPGWIQLHHENFALIKETFGAVGIENITHQRIGRTMLHQTLEFTIV